MFYKYQGSGRGPFIMVLLRIIFSTVYVCSFSYVFLRSVCIQNTKYTIYKVAVLNIIIYEVLNIHLLSDSIKRENAWDVHCVHTLLNFILSPFSLEASRVLVVLRFLFGFGYTYFYWYRSYSNVSLCAPPHPELVVMRLRVLTSQVFCLF